jgi:hypothetical protein
MSDPPHQDIAVITVIVTFKLPQPVTADEARSLFLGTAPRYQGVAGLIRKYYVRSLDGATAGGVYLWRSQADADALYTDEWRAFVRGKYGSDPVVTRMETSVVVDNLSGEIQTSA